MKHYKHRRRNPLGVGGGEMTSVIYGVGGAAGTLILSQTLLSQYNSGGTGILLNAGVALALGFVAGKVKPAARAAVVTGGLIAAGLRAASMYFPNAPGLSGYVTSAFAVPTVSNRYGQVVVDPYASLMPVVSAPGAASKGAIAAHAGMGRAGYAARRMRY